MKDYGKNKEPSYLKYWDVNNLYGWAMSQKLPVNGLTWVEDLSELNEDTTKIMMKNFFLKLMFNIPNIYMNLTITYHFCLQ